MNKEDILQRFAKSLIPTADDQRKSRHVLDIVAGVLQQDDRISVAEIWRCGSLRKGTALRGHSDLDVVALCSPKQEMSRILELMAKILEDAFDTTSEVKLRAVSVEVEGIAVDVVPTKIGIQGDLGRAQREKKISCCDYRDGRLVQRRRSYLETLAICTRKCSN